MRNVVRDWGDQISSRVGEFSINSPGPGRKKPGGASWKGGLDVCKWRSGYELGHAGLGL